MKIKGSKHLLVATLATMIALTTAAASVMTGCGDSAESANATTNVVETSIVTEIIEYTQVVTEGNGNSEKSENDDKNSNEKPQSSVNGNSNSSNNSGNSSSQNNNSVEKPESSNNSGNSSNQNNSSSSNNNSSNNNSSLNNNGSSNNNSSSSNSSSNKPNNTSKVLTVDGKKYNVGDTITCVYKVTAPENLENYEAIITYDSDYVEATSAVLGEISRVGGLCNHRLTEEVRMNGVNITDGYDFKKGETLITVTYLVKAGGKTSIDFNWRVATQFVTKGVGKPYVVDGKAVSGLKLQKIYS